MQNNPTAFRPRRKLKAALEAFVLIALMVCIGIPGCQEAPEQNGDGQTAPRNNVDSNNSSVRLPRLVDLGAGKCIPCKKMAPILDELKQEFAGSLDVVFIDVWQNKQAGEEFGIQSIPTQIFFDASGKELFRHEGFFAKEDILAKWKELGVDLQKKGDAASEKTNG